MVVNGISVLVHNTDPWDILYSHPLTAEQLETFTNGPWRGHPISEAIAEASKLGTLPPGLEIEAQEVNGRLVAVNNRTLYVAQRATLSNVSTVDKGGLTFSKLQWNFRDSGFGRPLEASEIHGNC